MQHKQMLNEKDLLIKRAVYDVRCLLMPDNDFYSQVWNPV